MRTLITGGAGFIGSHLAERLLAEGHQVSVIDNLSTGSFSNIRHLENRQNFRFVIGTILDEQLMEQLVDACDEVVHLAAVVGMEYVLDHPLQSLTTNIRGTEIVLEKANRGKKKVIIASTSEIYGKNGERPFKEDDDRVLGPTRMGRWSYATTKAVDEFLALAYWRERKVPVIVVRLFNVIGPRQTGQYGMVVPRFVKQALSNRPITVYGDGEQSRCFADISDVLVGLLELANHPDAVGEIFNLGSEEEIRINDLARKIKEMTHSASPIEHIPYKKAYGSSYEDLKYRVPDLTKIRNLLGYEPKVTLDQALRKIIDFYQALSSRPQSF